MSAAYKGPIRYGGYSVNETFSALKESYNCIFDKGWHIQS